MTGYGYSLKSLHDSHFVLTGTNIESQYQKANLGWLFQIVFNMEGYQPCIFDNSALATFD